MKRSPQLLSLLLALVLALAVPPAPALAADAALSAGESAPFSRDRALVLFREEADPEALAEAIAALPDVTLRYTYDKLFAGAAVEAGDEALAALEALPGVAAVSRTQVRSLPQTAVSDPLTDSNSLPLMGAAALSALGYDGEGTVIAVIDSGLRYTHEAFRDHGLSQAPALTAEDTAAFLAAGGTPGRYLSPRIPFAYDYYSGDDDVWTQDDHGTHIAALAAGYALAEDGAVRFRGAAPAAQILAMKVFPDNAGTGADDSDILRAMEDAWALGADVINLSLGSDSGFTADGALGGAYAAAFQTLREAGVILCCAAGNAGYATYGKLQSPALPTAGYTDYGTLASPASYRGATAIAAAGPTVYHAAGYLAAGDRQLPFSQGTDAGGGETPQLLSLAGQTLDVVPVDGVGAAADFAGHDLTGKIALVARGELSFTEKVQNAAAAGAAACLIYNNEPGTITPSVEDVSIPCAALTAEDGAFLLSLAAEGRGTVTVSDGAYLAEAGQSPTLLTPSAWGPTSDLRLVPALTAPGGRVLSASAAGDTAYAELDGTSMAAGSAAGAFALALQALRQRGIGDRAQAADLAEALLTSTARIVTDGEGTPLSPRRQGAGLIDLEAALTSPAVILDPLLELGDGKNGRLTLDVSVQNLSDQDLTFTPSVTVLTDGYVLEGETYYSSLSPLDLTDHVAVSGVRTLAVPAGETASLRLTAALDRETREALGEIFPNGFYLEGYVALTAEDGLTLHSTFLGYCGDWSAAPILEPTDHRDVLEITAALANSADEDTGESLLEAGYTYQDVLAVDLGANLPYLADYGFQTDDAPLLGQNPWDVTLHGDRYSAIAGQDSDALYAPGPLFTLDLYTLRNARRLIALIYDRETGEIYCVDDLEWLSRSHVDLTARLAQRSVRLWWDGVDGQGRPLPDGAEAEVRIYAWLESDEEMTAALQRRELDKTDLSSYAFLLRPQYEEYLELSFPLTIDSAAPTAEAAWDEEARTVTVTVSDGGYLAYAALRDGAGTVLAQGVFAGEGPGEDQTLTADLSGYDAPPDTLYLVAGDYAANTTGLAIPLAGDGGPTLCPAALLGDVAADAWYHEAVDFVFVRGLMDCGEPLTFRPEDGATRLHAAQALYALAGSPEPETADLPFPDAAALDGEALDAAAWAWENGVLSGYSDALLGAHAVIQRQQLAVMLFRFAGLTGEITGDEAALAAYDDGDAVSSWAREAMAWALETGVLTSSEGRLSPRGYVTRAELAQALLNFCQAAETALDAG